MIRLSFSLHLGERRFGDGLHLNPDGRDPRAARGESRKNGSSAGDEADRFRHQSLWDDSLLELPRPITLFGAMRWLRSARAASRHLPWRGACSAEG